MAESYQQLERKYERLCGEYVALRASHARLLEALQSFTGYVAADHNDTSLLDNYALWDKAQEAIAAAQPFTET